MSINLSDPRTVEIVCEDAAPITDGLMTCMSAFVEISPRCGRNFVLLFAQLHSQGLIKLKTAKIKKKRDWIRP
jgi:hypothetical protein